MKIISRENWSDGTLVPWEVEVHEVPMDEATLSEWYDRDAKENSERIEEGAIIRVFVVDKVVVSPDEERSSSKDEPIAGNEFRIVRPGDKLVVIMNGGEYAQGEYEKALALQEGDPDLEFSQWSSLINIQDCNFDVEVVER